MLWRNPVPEGGITKPVPIVALLDISGSMNEYTRLFQHFLHDVNDALKRVSVFLFGTRLTNITRALRARDPDEALTACSELVEDWSGGTRIALDGAIVLLRQDRAGDVEESPARLQ